MLPSATRLQIWYKPRQRCNTLPPEFTGLSLPDIHRMAGIGRRCYESLFACQLRGVAVTVEFNGSVIRGELDPCVRFPRCWKYVVTDAPGDAVVTIQTSADSCHVC